MSGWRKEDAESRATSEACSMVVVYENVAARDLAIRLCDAIAQKFLGDIEFDITWWRFDYLAEPHIAKEAAQATIQADLILVALGSEDIPAEVRTWFESCLPRRTAASDGALAIARTSPEVNPPGTAEAYLQLMARRSQLEYLPLSSADSATRLVDRLREDEVFPDTTGLDQTPDHPSHSSGWGINE